MNFLHCAWVLLAQLSRWQRLGDGLHRSRGRTDLADLLPFGIVLAAIGIAVVIGLAIKKRNDYSTSCDDPQKLFRELSRAHKLDLRNQRFLLQLASAFRIEQPAEIFLLPTLFDPKHLPQHLQGEKARLQKLRRKLFYSKS
ncbi:MAG: hypothetical protein MI725_16555 [Pirellulales bacterium]|nr:hypothetical protein [Pirellulales bacterium]